MGVTGGSLGTKAGPWPFKGPRNSARGVWEMRGEERVLRPKPEAAPAGGRGPAHRGHPVAVLTQRGASPGQHGGPSTALCGRASWDGEDTPVRPLSGTSPAWCAGQVSRAQPQHTGRARAASTHGQARLRGEGEPRVCEYVRVTVSVHVRVRVSQCTCLGASARQGRHMLACACQYVSVRVSACVSVHVSVRVCACQCVLVRVSKCVSV